MLVDFSKQVVGDRLALQIETSPHVKFLTNQMVWRIIARWDSQPWLNSTIKLADGSYQVSNAVVLDA
jgi:HK97 family phage major capsid protein